MTIRKVKNQYCLFSKKTGDKIACHPTREKAEEQERAIQAKKKEAVEIGIHLLDPEEEYEIRETPMLEEFFEHELDDDGPSSRAFLKKLSSLLGSLVDEEVFKNAVKKARAHAGGLLSGRKKKKKREEDGKKKKGGEADKFFDDFGGGVPKLSKDDERVDFRDAEGDDIRCGRCRFFFPPACVHVEGTIEPEQVCDLFQEKIDFGFTEPQDIVTLCASDGNQDQHARGDYGLFIAVALSELSLDVDWIPYLPIPGTYKHARYGEIIITRERNERFVDNFHSQVYQQFLPIDAEHETKVSGALGWVERMRMNEDGSVDARVNWTDRGKEMVAEDRFRFVSPEWFDQWTDPASKETWSDVAIGGALTTRPFFKEKALRPLVASENAIDLRMGEEEPIRFAKEKLQMPDKKKTEGFFANLRKTLGYGDDVADDDIRKEFAENLLAGDDGDAEKKKAAAEKAAAEKEAAEKAAAAKKAAEDDDPKVFAEMQETVRKATERADKAEEDSKKAAERISALEDSARSKRFNDIVMGRNEGGARFYGKPEENVEALTAISESFGEDSDFFKRHVEREQLHSKQLQESKLFSVIGTDAGSDESTAEGQLDKVAAELREKDPKLTGPMSHVQASEMRPDLVARYNKEKGFEPEGGYGPPTN